MTNCSQALYGIPSVFLLGVVSFIGTPYSLNAESAKEVQAPLNEPEQPSAPAMFSCRADISYRWKPKILDKDGKKPPTLGAERNVPFATAEASDTAEEMALSALLKRTDEQKELAGIACANDHESESSCVGSQLQRLSEGYERADFSGRRAILDSIKRDCENRVGECQQVLVSDPVCKKTLLPNLTTNETTKPTADSASKGKKDKKK